MPDPGKGGSMSLEEKIRDYYRAFYRDQLGHPDWRERVESRLNEEERFAAPVINKLERVLNISFRGRRVLVVGAGTGAEFIELHRRGAMVHGIEPNSLGIEIIREKCRISGIPGERVKEGMAEKLPYDDETFDFVYCYTVLEHVASVEASLKSMLRVLRVGGHLFVEAPNYRMPYEPHYKMMMPTFLPRVFQKLYLRLCGRPPGFIDRLNYINRRVLLDRMRHMPVLTVQILDDFPESFCRWTNPFYLFMRAFGMERDFWLVFLKLSSRRK